LAARCAQSKAEVGLAKAEVGLVQSRGKLGQSRGRLALSGENSKQRPSLDRAAGRSQMTSPSLFKAVGALVVLALAGSVADARALKWARSGDALTLDPHAQNEGPTHNLLHLIYEPLILRDRTGKLLPTLAISWRATEDPTVWEFKLRRGVKFHDGSAFNADDVTFSLERALQPNSDMKGLLTFIETASN